MPLKSKNRLVTHQRMAGMMRMRTVLRKKILVGSTATILLSGLLLGYFNFKSPQQALGSNNETLSSGAFIINMGVTPQTFANGLKPYGMLYDLIYNYNVPIKWIINSSKAKDGTDFTYGGTDYKGGPFIIRSEDITSSVATRITYWQGQGVQGIYTTSAITVPVYNTLTYFPKAMIDDDGNKNIIIDYYTDAAITSGAYEAGTPATLGSCHDIWVNPHGDPAWSTHSYLYNFVTVNKSFVWSQCHAVSVLEGVANPSSPFQQLNYLTTTGLKCYSGGKCGAGVTQTHAGSPTGPYTHSYSADPVMQFMGTMDGATDGGSEKWYIPQTTGAWRSTTKRLVTTLDGTSPGEGILMAYGPAFGDAGNGYVMYEGGHDLDGNGTTPEKVAAVRAFFNFLLVAGISKQIVVTNQQIPSSSGCAQISPVSVNVSGGNSPYTYSWTSTVGGTFANASLNSTNYTSPTVGSPATGVLKCVVTDACGRNQIISSIITIDCNAAPLPVSLLSFSAKESDGSVQLNWTTASELNNDYFTLSKSRNGQEFFRLAKIQGAGTTSENKYYSYSDINPDDGENYYSLSQTDYDGTTSSLDTKMVKIKKESDEVDIYPNPFHGILKIHFGNSSPAVISLIDVQGKLIYYEEVSLEEKGNEYSIAQDIPSGIYFLCITQGNKKHVRRVMKT